MYNQTISFKVADTTNDHMFLVTPAFSAEGEILFELAPYETGYVEVTTWLQDDGLARSHGNTSEDNAHMTCWGTCGCDMSDNQTSGVLTHGQGQLVYDDFEECVWVLSAAGDITLRFSDFDTEEHNDHVTIDRCSTWDCSRGLEHLARLHGNLKQVSSTVFTTTRGYRFMRVIFRSNVNVTRAGFRATWSASPLLLQSVNRSRAQVVTLAILPSTHNEPSASFSPDLFTCKKADDVSTRCIGICDYDLLDRNEWQNHSTIKVLQNAGRVTVQGLLSSTTSAGHLPETRVRTCVNAEAWPSFEASLIFDAPNFETPMAYRGLEYATDYAVVGNNVYSIESESDSLLSFQVVNKSSPRMHLIDRLSSGHDRLRFTNTTLDATAAHQVCAWAALEVDGDELVISGSGCTTQLEQFLPKNSSENKTPITDSTADNTQIELQLGIVGHWELSKDSFKGPMRSNPLPDGWEFDCQKHPTCRFTRKRNRVLCQELYDTVIEGAGVRDDSGVLGSALLFGPACKEERYSDWDAPDKSPLSMSSFVVNDGVTEYLQFDGDYNGGLVVGWVDDLVDGTEEGSRLPLHQLSFETSWIPSEPDVSLAGLVSVLHSGPRCEKGWSVSYKSSSASPGTQASSSIEFMLSVKANLQGHHQGSELNDMLVDGPGAFVTLSHDIPGGLPLDAWTHLVATYDGSMLRLFLNGELVEQLLACSSPPCGYDAAHTSNCMALL
jgi:hypothetical protein